MYSFDSSLLDKFAKNINFDLMMNLYKLETFKKEFAPIDKLAKIYDSLIIIIEKYIVNSD